MKKKLEPKNESNNNLIIIIKKQPTRKLIFHTMSYLYGMVQVLKK